MADDLAPLKLLPGIFTEASDRSARNRWKMGNNVRFNKDWPEKIKGWGKVISTSTFIGIARAILSWTSLTFSPWIALGTHLKLYVTSGSTYSDITPLADSGTLALDPFATTNLSDVVTVTHVAHDLTTGQYVTFSGATATGGLDMNGQWVVDVIIDADHYSFTHSGAATSTATGGGAAVAYEYDLEPGLADSIIGGGWGSGGWGVGTWGTPRTGVGFTQCRTWSLDKWGEDLIASPHRGAVYVWDTSVGTGSRAQIITQAPIANLIVKVSPLNRQLICFGCYDATLTDLDPMLIKWSDREDYTNFTPADDNRAGEKRLDNGTSIIMVGLSRGEYVIVTDTSIYTMSLSFDEFSFDFKGQGETLGAVSPNCGFDIGGKYYYMGRGQFVTFTGEIAILPCDVLSFVFTVDANRGFLGLNRLQSAKIYCGRNKTRNEIIWFYCSAASTEIDRCVGYCFEPGREPHWWLGDVSRTAWLDENVLYEEPIAPGADGYLYVHETGVNDVDAALAYSVKSYDLEIGNGETVMMLKRVVPDFQRIAGDHTLTLTGKKKPNGASYTKGPKAFDADSTEIGIKMRARQISIEIAGTEVDSDIHMGEFRIEVDPVSKK